jgi:superoxide dismutase
MLININATILVQILNFGISYYLFKTLLFKPALAVIEHDNAFLNSLNKRVEDDRVMLDERKQKQREQWMVTREFFKQQGPHIEPVAYFFQGIAPAIVYTQPSEQEIQMQTKKLTDAIVERLGSRYVA